MRLLAPQGNLTAVGDEAQCIYSWCGTPPSTLRDFTDHYPEARLHRTQAEALPLAEALDRAQIPFRMGPRGDTEGKDESPPADAVTLSTIHKAKGLEYPVVFLPGLQQNGFPHPKATTETQLDEEHRLFYVALTRAKERLYLSACQKGRPTPGGYFDQLPHDLIDTPLKLSAN